MTNIKQKAIALGAAVLLGISALPASSVAQTATEAWTGAIPGDTIYFGTDDNLVRIRGMLNNGDIDRAVVFASEYAESFEENKRSGKTSPRRYDAYNALCLALSAQKNYDAAREACDEAINESPERWMAYNSRGSLNLKSGNARAAAEDYRKALEYAPDTGDIKAILEHNVQLAQRGN
ncbi:hypothetical protein [Pseudemcibacter aquimaris]|uniref:hypothetical protein n=1 Tax=Pseudemcibacter aquimaris TaxID=2857064 RepID=UPI0020132ADB|nr:hypothetical protein [Pseudemcibacter aquimaris]MCC3862152.1 hypothetical protein [Pseudemcibacter aquimaris]WDU58905.1 tetratricopeptide repeat protein [Pseudemcibacter aquimaris]